jgi:hypothetical protein
MDETRRRRLVVALATLLLAAATARTAGAEPCLSFVDVQVRTYSSAPS